MAQILEYVAMGLLGVLLYVVGMSIYLCFRGDRSGKSGRDTHVSSNPRLRGPDEGPWIWPQ